MRGYVLTSGGLFAALVVTHILRVAVEGSAVIREPVFALSTLAAAAMSAWAWRTLRALTPKPR